MPSFTFVIIVGAIWILVLAIAWVWIRPPSSGSRFKLREADRSAKEQGKSRPRESGPLLLSGFSPDLSPHEILGVDPGASTREIKRAYRAKMKSYHPDRVGEPGTREWKDAQKIAEAINHAKKTLLDSKRS